MSGRFVRASSYRHVHGTAAKTQDQYSDLRPSCRGDANFIAASTKFFALPVQGGGGPVMVVPLSKTGRLGATVPKVTVHKGNVLDVSFNPFNYTVLATSAEDCYTCITQIPEDGLTENINKPLARLEGHEKKVTELIWHPTSNNILATGSADGTVRVWDVEKQAEVYQFAEHTDRLHSASWNTDGSQMASVGADKTLRIFDPRQGGAIAEVKAHEGSKKQSVLWMDNKGKLCTVGFTRNSSRQFHIWDPKNMDKPLSSREIDQSAGVLIPHYDPDNSILYLAGKGDSSVKYFEIVGEDPYNHDLAEFRDTSSQKGLCWLPKRSCDTTKCEIAKCLRVMRDSVVPVSFRVPRKSEMFQKDLFPDTYAGKATQTADEYCEGKNTAPATQSMKPGEAVEGKAAAMTVKASAADLQKLLDVANARIKELEAQLAAK